MSQRESSQARQVNRLSMGYEDGTFVNEALCALNGISPRQRTASIKPTFCTQKLLLQILLHLGIDQP